MKHKQPFITIGIAFYGCENYLEQCLQSLLNQSFTDFECILVNDGSPGPSPINLQDETWSPTVDLDGIPGEDQAKYIFDTLVGSDERFRYIKKENGGVSTARNRVLDEMDGVWLTWLDPDDWLLSEHLQKIFDFIDINSDDVERVYNYPYYKFYNTGRLIRMPYPKTITPENSLHTTLMANGNTVWSQEIIKASGLRYDERFGRGSKHPERISNGGEDFFFAYDYLSFIRKQDPRYEVIVMPGGTYMYREVGVDAKDELASKEAHRLIDVISENQKGDESLYTRHVIWVVYHWKHMKTQTFGSFFAKPVSLYLRLITRWYF